MNRAVYQVGFWSALIAFIQKWVKYSFLVHALVKPLIAIVYFYPYFSSNLLFIAMPWAITAPLSMLILAIMFKKEPRNQQQ